MNKQELINQIKEKKSFLCIGLDTDSAKIPKHLLSLEDPVFEFNKRIIDETKDLCVAFKLNIAFYESQGINGWKSLKKTIDYIPKDIFTIADAKRGDIGNTGLHYAKAFFNHFNCDAITVSPYMGEESIEPFIPNPSKGAYVLCRTSNKSSTFIQEDIFSKVISLCESLNNQQNIGLVVGATNNDVLMEVRNSTDLPFLIPGIGAQGGDLQSVLKINEKNMDTTLINVSRGIIFSGNKDHDSIRNSAKQFLNQLRGLNG